MQDLVNAKIDLKRTSEKQSSAIEFLTNMVSNHHRFERVSAVSLADVSTRQDADFSHLS